MKPRSIIDSLVFPEGLRWREGRLWFCDIEEHRIITATADGEILQTLTVPGEHMIGLTWDTNGELVMSGRFSRLFRRENGEVRQWADLNRDGGDAWANDVVIDGRGRLYLSSFGISYDLSDHESNAQRLKDRGKILLWHPDSGARVVADGLSMPNTLQVTADGGTLYCCDSFGHRLMRYRVTDDGSLADPTVVARFRSMPDGSTLDAEGAIWVALPHEGQARRILPDGQVTDVVTYDQEVFDVTLGGPEGRTLFAGASTLSATSEQAGRERRRPGSIQCVEVAVPGAA